MKDFYCQMKLNSQPICGYCLTEIKVINIVDFSAGLIHKSKNYTNKMT